MKICIIGGTGHIAKFLVPMLVQDGHKVVVVSSGRKPLPQEWTHVEHQRCSYLRDDDTWQNFIMEVEAEIIIDILGVDLLSTYKAGKGSCKQLIACGSLWMLGVPKQIPTPEITQGPCQFLGYARRYKEIQELIKVAAENVARAFWRAVDQPQKVAGKIFNVGPNYALSAVEFVDPAECYTKILPNLGGNYHFRAHMLPDISRLKETLGYSPKYTPEESMQRAVLWMENENLL